MLAPLTRTVGIRQYKNGVPGLRFPHGSRPKGASQREVQPKSYSKVMIGHDGSNIEPESLHWLSP